MTHRSPKWKVAAGKNTQSHILDTFTIFSYNWICIIFKEQYFRDKYIRETVVVYSVQQQTQAFKHIRI